MRSNLFLFLLFLFYPPYLWAQTPLLYSGHAHNDYTHKHPLYDALKVGMKSIEVDIHLHKGQLKVAHVGLFLGCRKTLKALYLDPLDSIISMNRGSVYENDTAPVVLMIDIKTDARETYNLLKQQLKQYSHLLTTYRNGEMSLGAITVLISGRKDAGHILSDSIRYVALDGGLSQIRAEYDSIQMPRVSGTYKSVTGCRFGKIRDDDREKLKHLIKEAHAKGRKIRLYAAPNRKKVWRDLLDAGVDWINVDRLKKFRRFMAGYKKSPGQ